MLRTYFLRSAAALLILGLLFSCSTSPVTGDKDFTVLTTKDEINMGRIFAQELEKGYAICNDKSINGYIESVGDKLVDVVHRKDLHYNFTVVNTVDINAFSIPGGRIFIYRGLLERLNNEAQLAAVLGHELGHASAMHIGNKITKTKTTSVILSSIVEGIKSGTLGNGSTTAETLLQMGNGGLITLFQKYSREDEEEADRLGILYAGRSGWHPQGMIQLLRTLKGLHKREPDPLEVIFADHPAPAHRIELAKDEIAKLQADGTFGSQHWIFGESRYKTRVLERCKKLPLPKPGIYHMAIFADIDGQGNPTGIAMRKLAAEDPSVVGLVALKNLNGKHNIKAEWITPGAMVVFSDSRKIEVQNYSQLSLVFTRTGLPWYAHENNLLGTWKLRISIDDTVVEEYPFSIQ